MAQQEPDTSEFLRTNSLPLLRSPIVPGKDRSPASTFRREPTAPDLEDFGYRDGPASGEVPEFERHQEATAIEVFYDLFFAANLTVFSEGQNITSPDKLATFVVYFSLLWFNWVLLGCFDVRFITDSMFERCARAIHFGVMVGFAVICPSLSLVTQVPSTYQTLSLILMTSRLTMALQYASIWWYCRQYKNTKLPLGIMVGLNVVSGFVFLGVAFAFNGSNKALYSIWFIITAIEAIVTVGLSLKWEVLSFQGTHLAPRISLLTFILMGEGIAIVCVSVVRIVTNANAWTPATIGNVTAGIANLYVIFMIYFDWRRSPVLPKIRQLVWCGLHYPFHLALRIFIEGSSQFVIWWKIFETLFVVDKAFLEATTPPENDPEFVITTEWFVEQLRTAVTGVFNTYYAVYQATDDSVNSALDVIATTPDDFWYNATFTEDDPVWGAEWTNILEAENTLYTAMMNSLCVTFKIDSYSSFVTESLDLAELEEKVITQNSAKWELIFAYSFVAAGVTLILMNILFIVSRSRKWTPFNYVRKGINFVVGIGLCLVTLVKLDENAEINFTYTPWPLPTLLLTFFGILVINHLPHPSPLFFRKKAPAAGPEIVALADMGYRDKDRASSSGHESQRKIRGSEEARAL